MEAVRLRTFAVDGLLALLLAVIGVFGTAGSGLRTDADRDVDWGGYALVLVAAVALVGRRAWPRAVLAVCTLATSGYLVLGYPYGPILLSFMVAVYTVARRLPTRSAALACGLALAVLLTHTFATGGPQLLGVIPGSAWVVVPFALGVTIRLNRKAAGRVRDEQARQYADAERLRVAQEVHDIVGHGLSAINMQAEIALHLLAKRPEQAEVALTAISRTSREALDELRVTLQVVRRAGLPGLPESRAALAGLARLDELVTRMSETGVPVRVETTGQPRPLPSLIDLAAYRVVQESLTNVLRHAGPASATVRLGYADREVTVEVTDTGSTTTTRPGSGQGSGQGLAGMRERVDALGGALDAGPLAGGGFRVYAKLPLP